MGFDVCMFVSDLSIMISRMRYLADVDLDTCLYVWLAFKGFNSSWFLTNQLHVSLVNVVIVIKMLYCN